jgi:hypothetical protein
MESSCISGVFLITGTCINWSPLFLMASLHISGVIELTGTFPCPLVVVPLDCDMICCRCDGGLGYTVCSSSSSVGVSVFMRNGNCRIDRKSIDV